LGLKGVCTSRITGRFRGAPDRYFANLIALVDALARKSA
jgi:hypothetical protein